MSQRAGRRIRAAPQERSGPDSLLSLLKEMEELLQFPTVAGHVEAAARLATQIARSTHEGTIANLAMKVISEVNALRSSPLPLTPSRVNLNRALWHLRLALQGAKSAMPGSRDRRSPFST